MSGMNRDCLITVSSPAEVVAVAPYLLGFHPADSLVVLGLVGRLVDFAARYDLPPDEDAAYAEIAEVIARQGAGLVVLLGYGPPGTVTGAVLGVGRALVRHGVVVLDVLRVADDRWWSYRGGPAGGTRCAPGLAAEAVFRGMVALPSRKAMAAQVAPVEGAARREMAAATVRAKARLADLAADDLKAQRGGQWVRKAGREAIRSAERAARSGRKLSDDEVAWLGVLLVQLVIVDYAVDRSGEEEWRLLLWAEVTRRVDPEYAPGPACLLAYAAWQAGDGVLARVAIDRALREDADHRISAALDRLLAAGLRPEAVVRVRVPQERGNTRRRNRKRTRSST